MESSLVQDFPKVHKLGSIEMAFASRQLDDVDRPVGDVLLQDALVPLDVERRDWNEHWSVTNLYNK